MLLEIISLIFKLFELFINSLKSVINLSTLFLFKVTPEIVLVT